MSSLRQKFHVTGPSSLKSRTGAVPCNTNSRLRTVLSRRISFLDTLPESHGEKEASLETEALTLFNHSHYHFGDWEIAMEADYDEVSSTTLALVLSYHYGHYFETSLSHPATPLTSFTINRSGSSLILDQVPMRNPPRPPQSLSIHNKSYYGQGISM